MSYVDWGIGWVLNQGKDSDHLRLVREALSALGEGVRKCNARIDRAYTSGCDEYGRDVADEEFDVVETLLGSAFTVCQTHIAAVVADVGTLHRIAAQTRNGKSGVLLTVTTTNKADIMRYGCPKVGATAVTVIEGQNALANYFKHHDEWVGEWSKLTRPSKDTADVITSMGLDRYSTGNLRDGAKALGNTNHEKMKVFADALAAWHKTLMADYEKELRQKKVIS